MRTPRRPSRLNVFLLRSDQVSTQIRLFTSVCDSRKRPRHVARAIKRHFSPFRSVCAATGTLSYRFKEEINAIQQANAAAYVIKMRFNHNVKHTMDPHPVIRQNNREKLDNGTRHMEVQMLPFHTKKSGAGSGLNLEK